MIGFAVVFVLVAWLASAVATSILRRPWVRASGPAVERRLAELAAWLPLGAAAAIVTALGIDAVVAADHCTSDTDHAHLCFSHGAAWAAKPWALGLLALATSVVAFRLGRLAWQQLRARIAVRRLAALAGEADVVLVASERTFCFVAGVRTPRIYVSTAARARLADDEWAAMLAHERAHIAARDLTRRGLLELALLVSLPFRAGAIRLAWDDATERLRDADAARGASADAVASALVAMARGTTDVPGLAFTEPGTRLIARVEALLANAPRGEQLATRIDRAAKIASGLAIAAIVLAADPLHHAIEHLLG